MSLLTNRIYQKVEEILIKFLIPITGIYWKSIKEDILDTTILNLSN